MQIFKKSPISLIHFFILFLFLISLSKSDTCPRDKPIFKSGICNLTYCTEREFSLNTCVISNELVKTQWINKFHIIEENYMSHISVTENYKGELFISSQKVSDDFDKYLLGFNSDGEGLFYDKTTHKYNCFEIIDFAKQEYAKTNNYIEINGKGYLMGVPDDDDIHLIDYISKEVKGLSIYPYSVSSDTVFQMKNLENTIFSAYIFCKDTFRKDCRIHFQKYKFDSSLTRLVRIQNITNINTLQSTRIYCNENEEGYIICFYAIKIEENLLDLYLSIINSETFVFEDTLLIEHNYTLDRIFDETMHLKKGLYILARSINEDVIKIEFKNIILKENSNKKNIDFSDYFSDIKQIYLNEDKKFLIKKGSYKRNDLYKINDNKFVTFIKDYSKDMYGTENSVLLIYIFTIFNNDKNISVRRYSINFQLYNTKITDDIRGFSLSNFFGVVVVLTEGNAASQTASFMTFGYVNSTEQESIDTKLKYNNENSKIKISEYINEIENNLFGYHLLGVKIIFLPPEEDSGYFVNDLTRQKIKKDEIVSRDTQLQFILSNSFKEGNYLIKFAGIVEEPSFEDMNKYCEELVYYPENENENINEKQFYEPKILIGKIANYKFRLSNCYDSCKTCTSLSEDENDQKCIVCREGFYFKEGTNNCYDKVDKFYLDKEDKVFKPCYKNCLTCSGKESSPYEMNCLSCENGYKLYNKSNNCLNCPKYVNVEQNQCVNENTIPDGYYLEDSNLGSLGKCYYLCLTCYGGPYIEYFKYYMNCKKCYGNTFAKNYNCTDSYSITDAPERGQCPIDKPILKDGKCSVIYCTDLEYKYQICVKYNQNIKIQWLNDFQDFFELDSSSESFSFDIIKNQKMNIIVQNINKGNGNIEKNIFGFYKNGTGIFYNKNKDTYNSFKKISFPENENSDDNIEYIPMENDGYYLTTAIENNLYLIDLTNNKIIKKEIDNPNYSYEKIILTEKESTSGKPNYLASYIYCKDKTNLNDCYLMMKNIEINTRQLIENPTIKVNPKNQLNCFKDEDNYMRCTYTKLEDDSSKKHVLGIFSSESFNLLKEFELENNYDNDDPAFDSILRLKNNICVISYSSSNNNIIKILLKNIHITEENDFSISDYIAEIPEILINENNLYVFEGGKASSNSIVKMTDNKFALLVGDFKNINKNITQMIIFILSIYNSNSKINIRHYIINFSLYNYLIDKKITGYNFNGFLSALVELRSADNDNLKKTEFLIFGYMNLTDIDPIEGSEILIEKKENIIIKKYIKFDSIENNIFGYNISDKIMIISVPDENDAGTFTVGYYNSKLNKDDYIGINSEIKFTISNNAKKGTYSIVFAPFIEEPDYNKMESYYSVIESYPKGQTNDENRYYSKQSMIGKYFSFNFKIGFICYENCKTCYQESEDENDQQCNECKSGFYKVSGTNNCFFSKEKYYLDRNFQEFMPCYKDCLSCNGPGDENKMNCLSCETEKFNYYAKSTNCLKCQKYVDYSQTKCINDIPEGYFLKEINLGTIEKCHELCKSCNREPTNENGIEHMNCKTCKFTNNDYQKEIEGNCPETQGNKTELDEKKEDGNDGKEFDENKEEKKGNNVITLALVLVVCIVVILTIIAVIVYKKCFSNKSITNIDPDLEMNEPNVGTEAYVYNTKKKSEKINNEALEYNTKKSEKRNIKNI